MGDSVKLELDEPYLVALHHNVNNYFALQHKPISDYHPIVFSTQHLPLGKSDTVKG